MKAYLFICILKSGAEFVYHYQAESLDDAYRMAALDQKSDQSTFVTIIEENQLTLFRTLSSINASHEDRRAVFYLASVLIERQRTTMAYDTLAALYPIERPTLLRLHQSGLFSAIFGYTRAVNIDSISLNLI